MINFTHFGLPVRYPKLKKMYITPTLFDFRFTISLMISFLLLFSLKAEHRADRIFPAKLLEKSHVSGHRSEISSVDLGIIKSSDKSSAATGELIAFTMKVYNEGNADAHNVIVGDPVPSGTAFVSANPAVAYSLSNGTWNCGTVPAGDTLSFVLTVRVEGEAVIISQAEVLSLDETDSDSTPNNGIFTEDDWASACASIPCFYCKKSDVKIEAEAPLGYQNYKWFRNGQLVSNERLYLITDFGSYHYEATASPNNDIIDLCCPIEVLPKCISVGDLVWKDLNNNGKFDIGEPGLPNVQLVLFDAGTNGIDPTDIPVDTVYTDSNGAYAFSGMAPGIYYIKIPGLGVPPNYISSTGDGTLDNDGAGPFEPGTNSNNQNEDHGTQTGTSVVSGLLNLAYDALPTSDDNDPNTNLTIDFGFYRIDIFDLSLTKKLLPNQSNTVSPGDTLVYLIEISNVGNVDATDVSVVDNLPAELLLADADWIDVNGTAVLIEPIPSILVGEKKSVEITTVLDPAFQGTSIANFATIDVPQDTFPDNDVDTMIVDLKKNLITLGGTVWTDTDNDGYFDLSELGVENVKVELYSAGNNGKDATDTLKATVFTDANGLYSFANLIEGNYYVKLVDNIPLGTRSSTGNGPSDPGTNGAYEPGITTDNDNEDHGTQNGVQIESGIIVLVYDNEPRNDGDNDPNTNYTVDFGVYEQVQIPSGLSGLAFLDCNNDGVSTGDSPLQGITVTLIGNNVNTSQITDANGIYSFGNVAAGTYHLTFSKPSALSFTLFNQGTNDAIDSDVNPANGSTDDFIVVGGENYRFDAGYNDKTAPVFASLGSAQNLTVECDAIPAIATLTATDNFDTNVTILYDESETNGSCTDNYVLNRTWTALDDCGNQTQHVQIITVRDTKAPVFGPTPLVSDITVDCNQIPVALDGFSATDNCDTQVEIIFSEERINGFCANSYTLVRTWIAKDNCGNATPKVQIIKVQDGIDPVFSSTATDETVSCENIPFVPLIAATDNCDDDVRIAFDESVQAGACSDSYLITRLWVASDNCGNTAELIQHITVEDKKAPVFANVPASVTVNCGQTTNQMPTATDNCDKNVEVSVVETTSEGDCATGRTITREFTAVDNCGNTSKFTQTVLVIDTEAPRIINTPTNVTVNCRNVPPPAKITVIDNCPGAVMIMFDEQKTAGDNCTGFKIIRTWTAMDACGNQTVFTQELLIDGDRNAPEIVGVPDNAEYDCTDVVPLPSLVSANDDCDNNPKLTLIEDKLGFGCGYKLIRVWTATDKCGNVSTKLQTITVRDRTAPSISGMPDNITVDCADALPPKANPVAVDACDNNAVLTFSETLDGNSNSCTYKVIRIWTATDKCGNVGSKSQVITVIDTKGPVITPLNPMIAGLPSGGTMTVECDQVAIMDERDVAVNDNCDKNPTIKFDEYGTKKGNCAVDGYLYTLNCRWTATDRCGNTSVYEFTLKVIDTKAPIISNVPASVTLNCGETLPTLTNPTVADNCDKNIQLVYAESTVNGNCAGNKIILRRWTATDHCGNVNTATQTITIQDNVAPVITKVPVGQSVVCGQLADANNKPIAIDNCDNQPALTYSDALSSTGGCLGSIVRTWTATDACGNSTTATQVISIRDTEAPVINVNTTSIVLDCGQPIPDTPVSVTDNCDLNPVLKFRESRIGTDCDFKIIREWTATDKCGNEITKVKTITVYDKTPPVIAGIPADFTTSCSDPLIAPTSVLATDFCDANPVVKMEDNVQGDPNACQYKVIRTWTATDKCGNSSTKSMTITVKDLSKPVITPKSPMLAGVPSGGTITVECDQLQVMNENDVIVTDDCDKNPTVKFDEYNAKIGKCETDGYLLTITCRWTATDKCGNTSVYEFTVISKDTKAPVLAGVPDNLTLDCKGSLPSVANVTATDNCSKDVKITYSEAPYTAANCTLAGSVLRTWTATDDCGNSTSKSQLIIFTDNEKPQILGVHADITLNPGEVEPQFNVKAIDNCDSDVPVQVTALSDDSGCFEITVYTYTATDDCGNVATQVYTVTRFKTTALVANIDINTTAEQCGLKNGTAGFTPASYTYTWNDGYIGATREKLSAGSYQVTVSDQCATKVITVVIGTECPCVLPEIISTVIVPAGCGGSAVGSIAFNMKDGNPQDYNFEWSTANGISNSASNLSAGEYRLIITRKSNPNCTNKFTFTVGEKSLVNIFEQTGVTLEVNDCVNGKAALCTALTPAELSTGAIVITDNGVAFSGNFKGCKFDSLYYYNLSFSINSGSYLLNKWTINGKSYSGEFNTINDLLALMNSWDPNGNWQINQAGKIYGGQSSSFYSKMDIGSKNDPNFVGTADLEVKITPYALAIELGVGTHNLVATSADGCQDAIKVTVECKVLPPDCKSFIASKSETLFTTCGTPSKLYIADLPFADIASYSISDNGNPFSGAISKCNDGTALTLTNGIHQLIFTNKAGCKDTMEARVACTTAKYVVETIYLNQKDTVCLDVAELLGSIAGIDNIWPGQSGAHAKFELIPGSRCITCLGVNAGGTDRAAFVITDDQGIRDTTFFEITVKAKDPKGPDAIEDAAKINQGDVMVLDVLANDKLGNLPLTEIRIVQQPKNAFVFVNNENKVVFTPNADFCDDNADESFTYKICTKEGCDEAPVLIKVLCSGIKVFTGFSPNGDGVNDTFVIEGAADQSTNKLSIFNRYGNQVFYKEAYKNDWNGTWDGNNLPDGTYYYLYEDGKGETKAGYIQILR